MTYWWVANNSYTLVCHKSWGVSLPCMAVWPMVIRSICEVWDSHVCVDWTGSQDSTCQCRHKIWPEDFPWSEKTKDNKEISNRRVSSCAVGERLNQTEPGELFSPGQQVFWIYCNQSRARRSLIFSSIQRQQGPDVGTFSTLNTQSLSWIHIQLLVFSETSGALNGVNMWKKHDSDPSYCDWNTDSPGSPLAPGIPGKPGDKTTKLNLIKRHEWIMTAGLFRSCIFQNMQNNIFISKSSSKLYQHIQDKPP